MTFVIGYIFSGSVPLPKRKISLIPKKVWFDWERVKVAMIVTAPGVVVHELAHKFVAIIYGYSATFHIFSLGLGIGLLLKIIGAPFLIVAPGYVNIASVANPIAYRLIAFAGPAINLILWLGSWLILKTKKNIKTKHFFFLQLTKQINMILFFFNMIPFGFFDGAKVVFGP